VPETEKRERRPVVFFVDDEEGVRQIANRLLRKRGFDMIGASTAAEAAEIIESFEGDIDALLMDINLPDGWGALVAQRLMSVRPGMAIVYTTGFAEVDPILSGGLNSAEYVIRKPFTGDHLADVLKSAIAAKGRA
jgi:FixJ family two-component response regulator